MPDSAAEFVSPSDESPYWKPRETLNSSEKATFRGTLAMERMVDMRSRLTEKQNIEELSKDLYSELFSRLGHQVRSYRETGTIVVGGVIEYPEYLLVPRHMREHAAKLNKYIDRASESGKLEDVIEAASTAHAMVYIHPFPDGNGRISRAMTHFVLRKFGLPRPNWKVEGRDAYLDAVSAGYENEVTFKKFLTETIIATYKQRLLVLNKKVYGDYLPDMADSFKRSINALSGYLVQLDSPNKTETPASVST